MSDSIVFNDKSAADKASAMFGPLVSVIVPVYEVEPYLRRCVDSVLAQTYRNLEIILVDDGSPDDCPSICDEYAAKDGRIAVVHKENGGLSDARNAGLDIAKGDYISFVDGDDWVDEDYVESLLRPVSADGCEMVVSDYRRSDETTPVSHILAPDGVLRGNRDVIAAFCAGMYPPSACAKLYAADFLNTRFRKGLLFEDQLWSCELAVKASCVCIVHERRYHYEIRGESIMTAQSADGAKRLESWQTILRSCRELLAPCLPEMRRSVDLFMAGKATEMFVSLPPRGVPFRKIFFLVREVTGKSPIALLHAASTGKTRKLLRVIGALPEFAGIAALRLLFALRKGL